MLPLADVAASEIEALLDAAFGADRFQRTAYKLRAGVMALSDHSFAVLDEVDRLVASLQSWPIELVDDDGGVTPLVLVGPIAVMPDRQRDGIGRKLTAHALATLDQRGHPATMLIGDPEYYGRFFGYDAAPAAGWRLPGPVEQRRVLARIAPAARLPAYGSLRPRRD